MQVSEHFFDTHFLNLCYNFRMQRDEESQFEASDEGETAVLREKSAVAVEIERLKRAALDAARQRERLPQPLFWSLFGHAIQRLKDRKNSDRSLRELFLGEEE